MQAGQARGQPLGALMEACRKGGALEGCTLAGRLGDLGSIEAQLDVAVSTAAGALDSLVTETTEGAERCVKVRERAGHAQD
jgi:structural maintenance of chromosome 4